MTRINLLPVREVQRAIGRRRQLSVAILCACVALLVMVVPYALQGIKLSRLADEIDQLKAESAKLDEQAREVRELDAKRAELQAKLQVIEDLKQKRVGPVRILDDLATATPEKLWLVEFNDVENQATITGMALDNQTIAAFMRQLQESRYFYEVDLVETSQSAPLQTTAGVRSTMMFKKFIVKARLDYRGKGGAPADADGPQTAQQARRLS